MSDITKVDSDNRANELYNPNSEVVSPEKEERTEEVVANPKPANEKAEEVAQEVLQKAEVTKAVVQKAPTKVALPALNLRSISRKDVEKKDKELVKAHIPSRIKDMEWDAARNVVVIVKSGKTRAYPIGNGAAPALIENKNRSEVTAYLNKM